MCVCVGMPTVQKIAFRDIPLERAAKTLDIEIDKPVNKAMEIKDLFKKYVPNPLDSGSTLPGLNIKSEVIIETFSFSGIIKNVIFLIVVGFILLNFLQVPTNVVGILIGFAILSTSIVGYLKYLKIKSLSSINPAAAGENFKKIAVIREYYNLIISIVDFCTSLISTGLILLFFGKQISNLFILNPAESTLSLMHLILAFIIFRLLGLIINSIKYQIIKGINSGNNIAQVNQSLTLVNKKFELITFLPGVSAVLLILFLIGIPGYIVSIFLGFVVLMVILSLVELRRIGDVDLSVQTSVEGIKNFGSRPNEKLIGTIFGIMNLSSTGSSFLGVGKTTDPENTLLLTDNRLLFVQVPIPGSNNIVDTTVYSDMNFLWNRKEIQEKGNQVVSSMTLDELSKQYGVKEIPFDEIKNLTLKKMEISILTNTNQKLKYLFMDTNYIEPLKQILQTYIKEKFIEIR